MSGGTTTQQAQQQSSNTNPYAPAQPMLQSILNSLGGQSTSPSAGQTNAVNLLQSEAAGTPSFGAAGTGVVNNLLGANTNPQQGILNGAYGTLQGELSPWASGANNNPMSNPAISSLINTTNQDTTNAIDGQFAAAGRDLSPANTTALARGLSQGESGILTNQYNTDVQNQINSAGMLSGAAAGTASGLTAAQQAAAGLNTTGLGAASAIPGLVTQPGQTQLQAATTGAQLPLSTLQGLEGLTVPIAGLGTQSSGTSTGTTQQQAPWWTSAIGAGMLGASFLPSDERIKENKEQVGILNNGLPVYSYNLKNDPAKTPQIGLIAQDVEKVKPEAVGQTPEGIKTVDYAKATEPVSAESGESGYFPSREPSTYDRAAGMLHDMRTSIPNLNPGMDPQAIDAQRAAQAQQPIGDAAQNAWNTATSAAGPLTSLAIGGAQAVGSTLAPSALGADEPLSAAEQRKAQLLDLEGKVTAEQKKRDAAAAAVPFKRNVITDANGNKTVKPVQDPAALTNATSQYDADLALLRKQQEGLMALDAQENEAKGKAEAPWAQTATPGEKKLVSNMPAVAGGLGLLGGIVKNKPMTYAVSGAMGTAEGAGAGFYPTYRDLQLPEGSPGRKAAEARLHDPSFWLTQVAPEAAAGGLTGLLGTYYGGRLRDLGAAGINGIRGLLSGAAESAPIKLPTAPSGSAPASPNSQTWAPVKDANGRYRWPVGHPYAGKWAPSPKNTE